MLDNPSVGFGQAMSIRFCTAVALALAVGGCDPADAPKEPGVKPGIDKMCEIDRQMGGTTTAHDSETCKKQQEQIDRATRG